MTPPKRTGLEPGDSPLQRKLYDIIFGWKSPAGKSFDILLLAAIVASVIAICLSSVDAYKPDWETFLWQLELGFTILFTIEYLLRLYCVKNPLKYVFSFFGVIDLLAILPTYWIIFFNTRSSLAVIRLLRLLRVFRILNLVWLMREADDLGRAVMQARAKIVVFLGVVLIAVTIAGTLVFEIEHAFKPDESKFQNIPDSIYWAIVTMTTVGYGDIVPITAGGKFVSAVLILLGYSLIIVPTGFVSAELMDAKLGSASIGCDNCDSKGHFPSSTFCKDCGSKLSS